MLSSLKGRENAITNAYAIFGRVLTNYYVESNKKSTFKPIETDTKIKQRVLERQLLLSQSCIWGAKKKWGEKYNIAIAILKKWTILKCTNTIFTD